MPRKRPPERLDEIADAATTVFIRRGFALAKIAEIAHLAGVGPGTIYLYAEGKDALFDLALRRAFEDPTLLSPSLPHPARTRAETADHFWRCVQNAAHFPRLWLAAESPAPRDVSEEVEGVMRELYDWLNRYRLGIQLVDSVAPDWPEVARLFHRRFWRGGVRRLAGYLKRRAGEGALSSLGSPLAAAHLIVESFSWMAVRRHWSLDPPDLPDEEAAAASIRFATDALLVSE